jgi:hypothetical protein
MAGRDYQGRGAKTDLIQQENWAGGINSASQAEEISNVEAQDIENFEYDSDDNLIVRTGIKQFIGSTTYTTRITSIHRYVDSAGTVRIIWTNDNDIWRSDENGGSVTDITGGLTLPTNTFWQWRTFAGSAIGVNKGTGGNANPVKVNGSSNAVALGGSPPKAKYIEVWNNRLWLVDASNPNRVWGSKLGDPENWTDTTPGTRAVQIDFDAGDGDEITGLVEFRNSLFVFKRKKIHVLSTIAAPTTDPDNFRQDIYTKNLGCFAPYSIQPVLNDVLFLSDSGIASLAQSELGELKSALLSSKIAELSEFKKNTNEIASFVLDDKNQYWISLPAAVSPRAIPETYVFHYDKIEQGIRRWTRFTGRITGTAFSEKMNGDYKEYLIGYQEGTVNTIYKYSPIDPVQVFNDSSQAYNKVILSKAYSAEALMLRKDWIRFGYGIRLLTDNLAINVKYFFNGIENNGDDYPFTFEFTDPDVLIWDVGFWDDDSWASEASRDEYVWRKFKKSLKGRKGVTVTLKITNTTVDQAYILKYMAVEHRITGHKKVKTT